LVERLLAPVILGAVGSLLAAWLSSYWPSLDTRGRLLVSGAFGLAIALVVFTLRKPTPATAADPNTDKYGSDLRGRGDVEVRDLDIETNPKKNTKAASDLVSRKGGISVSGISVRRGGDDAGHDE